MKTLRYISTQPATDYYTWQVEVMINNFIKHGVSGNNMDIVSSYKGTVSESWRKLQNKYNYVRFFFYEDTRVNSIYPVTIRPHLLKKHFTAHPYLTYDAIMYHDTDIVFTKSVNWNKYLQDDVWYGSDVISYLGAKYIQSKKYGVYERMCEIVGLEEQVPSENEMNTIGAQLIMKNVTVEYWEKVEQDCELLYQFFLDHLKAFPEGCLNKYHPIQKWTAEMWALLWNAWKFGHTTSVGEDMSFAWPMHNLDSWEKHNIFHNAGVIAKTADEDKLFFKGKYVDGTLPYDITLENFDATKCTHKYVQEILEVGKKSCLL
jgi:hypothetical protein